MNTQESLDSAPMPWCERCQSYHHASAPHISVPARTVHDANTIAWKMGDLVIHDDDAKRPDMLMRVVSRIASGKNQGLFRTRYAYPHLQPKSWQRKIWVNPIGKLHDPRRFNIDTTRAPTDRFSRDLERKSSRAQKVSLMDGMALDNKHQIYAELRKSSEYRHQTHKGEVFPVRIGGPGGYGEYIVEGNSNRYRLRDLRFYVRLGDKFIPLGK